MSEPTRYPLCWPAGRPRTSFPQPSKFGVESFARVRDELLGQLKLLGAKGVILSTNLRLCQDGLPLANQPQPADAGAAVYFDHHGQVVCFACDRWRKVEDNLQAIWHTIEALRGIARWGTGDMMRAAFTGFVQLHAAVPGDRRRDWHEVLGVLKHASNDDVQRRYRVLAKEHHPDRNPGDAEAAARYAELDAAFEQFKRERGL